MSLSMPKEMCMEHKKMCDIYCENCRHTICVDCIGYHCNCQIIYLDSAVKREQQRLDGQKIYLKSIGDQLNYEINCEMKLIEDSQNKEVQNIAQIRTSIEEAIRNCKQQGDVMCKQVKEESLIVRDRCKQRIEERMAKLNGLDRAVKLLEQIKPMAPLMDHVQAMKSVDAMLAQINLSNGQGSLTPQSSDPTYPGIPANFYLSNIYPTESTGLESGDGRSIPNGSRKDVNVAMNGGPLTSNYSSVDARSPQTPGGNCGMRGSAEKIKSSRELFKDDSGSPFSGSGSHPSAGVMMDSEPNVWSSPINSGISIDWRESTNEFQANSAIASEQKQGDSISSIVHDKRKEASPQKQGLSSPAETLKSGKLQVRVDNYADKVKQGESGKQKSVPAIPKRETDSGNNAGGNNAGGNNAGGNNAGGNNAGGINAGGINAGGNNAGSNNAGGNAPPATTGEPLMLDKSGSDASNEDEFVNRVNDLDIVSSKIHSMKIDKLIYRAECFAMIPKNRKHFASLKTIFELSWQRCRLKKLAQFSVVYGVSASRGFNLYTECEELAQSIMPSVNIIRMRSDNKLISDFNFPFVFVSMLACSQKLPFNMLNKTRPFPECLHVAITEALASLEEVK